MVMMIALFLTLPLIAIISAVGFSDAGWEKRYHGKGLPYSLGAFILYSYAALCAYFPSENLFFSYISLLYATVVWMVGFYFDRFIRTEEQRRNVFQKHPSVYLVVVAAMLFAWYATSGSGDFLLLGMMFVFLLAFPAICQVANRRPLRLWKFSFCLVVFACFFMEVPVFTDVLYAVTVLYIAFVLEGEGQASYGYNGAFLIGTLLAVWMTSVLEQPIQLFLLAFGLFCAVLFMLNERVFYRFTLVQWLGQLGLREK